jgi:hypothetical protein
MSIVMGRKRNTMKSKQRKYESGQALIVIVFAMIGLIGLTALTIDGGTAYSDRRHAQNAADTAALAAARAIIRNEQPWKNAALSLATTNGYADTDSTIGSTSPLVNVEVYKCDETVVVTPPIDCGTYAGNPDYLLVRITAITKTTFGNVLGISQLTNRVYAIAHAKPGYADADRLGNAMVSLMNGCKGDDGWNKDPFKVSGNSTTVVGGSGIFVNSTCPEAMRQSDTASHLNSEDGVCVVGGALTQNIAGVDEECGAQLPNPPIVYPNPSCDLDKDGIKDPNEIAKFYNAGSYYYTTPGYWTGDFPPNGQAGLLIMNTGVYCIENGDFNPGSQWNISTDSNQDGIFQYATEGVLIFVRDGEIKLNGGSTLDMHAISNPIADADTQNYLFVLPDTNDSPVTINGNSGSEFTGTILAPASHVELSGSSLGTAVNSQIIGYSIELTGTGNLTITYNAEDNATFNAPPSMELVQ